MLSKAKVLESIKEMPEQFNLDELFERMIFLQKIEIGLAQATEGKVVSHEELTNDSKGRIEKSKSSFRKLYIRWSSCSRRNC